MFVVSFISVPATVFFPAYSLYFFAPRYPPLAALMAQQLPTPAGAYFPAAASSTVSAYTGATRLEIFDKTDRTLLPSRRYELTERWSSYNAETMRAMASSKVDLPSRYGCQN